MEYCVFIKLRKKDYYCCSVSYVQIGRRRKNGISLKILCRKSGVIFMMESRLENNKEGETIKDEWHVFV